MVVETYQCACDGYTEYGWTIKESHDHDDSLYDIIVGTVSNRVSPGGTAAEMQAGWDRTWAAAEAFAAAL